jgi:hypothetical protein
VNVTDVDRLRRYADCAGAGGALSAVLAVTASHVGLQSVSAALGGLALLPLVTYLGLRARERRARGLPAVPYATIGAVLLFAMIATELILAVMGIQGKRLGP